MSVSLHEQIAAARTALAAAGIPEGDAAFDAEVLARHALNWDRAALLSRWREPPPPGFAERFDLLVRRRAAREPVALIVGHREFWTREFEVTRGVLVPRPETELIVEIALGASRTGERFRRTIDVGTGTGCLAVTLAAEWPGATVIASDRSAAALAVTARNAARHGVDRRVRLVRADLLEPFAGEFDLIVSNPPYVPSTSTLPPEVARFDPPEAVFAGNDGLNVLRRLIGSAPRHLAREGLFVVEFGFGQADAVHRVARESGWRHVEVALDLQGIPRVAVMER